MPVVAHPFEVQDRIVAWFDENGRELPWREPSCSPWGVLVSEIMLQQTPVSRVLPRWLEWLERWPTPQDLAVAPTADVLRAWDRLGYPRRALRLRDCAQAICERFDGRVPNNEPDLLSLPGIGEYTAAAVVAFAYRRRSVVLDTNVRRVFARLFDGQALPDPHLNKAERQRAGALVPETDDEASRWAAASMELGALICTAKNPSCQGCPVLDRCAWVAAGQPVDTHAHRRKTQAWHGTDRQVRGQIMALLRGNDEVSRSVLLQQVSGAQTQFDRCLTSLVADGLAVEISSAHDEPTYRLPV
ncbi:A/G-specific DNA-adenine glycosylase [Micrococcales bacterium KH10]|nr:A/G-specific DNA-adenine glycosylase [Micrococcales bacterium KH10]